MNRRFRLHHLYVQERAGTSTYIDTRTVFLSKYLKKGSYVLVPTMFQHGRTSEFLLRIFSEVPVQLRFSFIFIFKLLFSFPLSSLYSFSSMHTVNETLFSSLTSLIEMKVVKLFLRVEFWKIPQWRSEI